MLRLICCMATAASNFRVETTKLVQNLYPFQMFENDNNVCNVMFVKKIFFKKYHLWLVFDYCLSVIIKQFKS